MKEMKKQLIELLDIYAPSGKEMPVREYLQPLLAELMDEIHIDNRGNLLASKDCGTGLGANIMLSAHMDTVRGVQPNKKVIDKSGIITAELPNCTSTVLGADDRAGIAIIMTVLRNIPDIVHGNLKVAFTTEEDVGCVGADNIDVDFYKDVDLAIVVDRKGNRDIVVGCDLAFCSDRVGFFMEGVSMLLDMDYTCVEGGVSDALIFSSNGINSINISAGYQNEHTSKEFVSVKDMQETTELIIMSLTMINGFFFKFGDLPLENKWIKGRDVYD
jgi:putative aminopeptidase FrvX